MNLLISRDSVSVKSDGGWEANGVVAAVGINISVTVLILLIYPSSAADAKMMKAKL